MSMKTIMPVHPAPVSASAAPCSVNALLSAAFLGACATFRPGTPVVIMMAVLVIGGFFRSLEFTCINTIAYAEVDQRAHEPRHLAGQRSASSSRCRSASRSARWWSS